MKENATSLGKAQLQLKDFLNSFDYKFYEAIVALEKIIIVGKWSFCDCWVRN